MINQSLKRVIFYALNIIIPLIIGLLIYLALRPDSYIANIFYSFGIYIPSTAVTDKAFVAFLKNFVNDILWAYSLTFAAATIVGHSKRELVITGIICLTFEIIIELLQQYRMFHGTFDLMDIIYEMIAIVLALFIIKNFERKLG